MDTHLTTLSNFLMHPWPALMIIALLGVAITGGMFVVPLYAFLTTTVPKTETARTVAANNIVNSGAMVVGWCWPSRSPSEFDRSTTAPGRGHVPHFRLARLETPPRLRLTVEEGSVPVDAVMRIQKLLVAPRLHFETDGIERSHGLCR